MAIFPILSDAGDGYYNINDTPHWHQSGDASQNDFVIQWIGLVFESIPIPKNSLITSSTIDVFGFGASPGTATIFTKITGFAQDNAPVFGTDGSNEPSTRPATNSSLEWDSVFPFSFARRASPDISPIVQEIVNRSGWASGNNIGFELNGTATSTGNMASSDYAGGAANAAHLNVTWLPPRTLATTRTLETTRTLATNRQLTTTRGVI